MMYCTIIFIEIMVMMMIVRNYDRLYNNCIEIMVMMMMIVRNYDGLYN